MTYLDPFRLAETYGNIAVYRHTLFQQSESAYAIADGGCPVAEKIGTNRAMVLLHFWLGADGATIETMGDIFAKVAENTEALTKSGG